MPAPVVEPAAEPEPEPETDEDPKLAATPGPSDASAPADPRAALPASPPLIDALRDWAGDAPLLMLAGEHSLLAYASGETRELAPLHGPDIDRESFQLDPARDILWYVDHTSLWALDLRAAPGPALELVTGVPEQWREFALLDANVWLGHERVPEYFQLVWTKQVALSAEGTWGEIINEGILDALAAMVVTDEARAWLATLDTRPLDPVPGPAPLTQIEGVPLYDCGNEEHCGQAVAWPGTEWFIYVDSFDCGDYCSWSCTLWDPEAKRSADPEQLPTPQWEAKPDAAFGTCATYFTDEGGRAFTAGGRYCQGQDCVELPGLALGFIDPGPTIQAGPG